MIFTFLKKSYFDSIDSNINIFQEMTMKIRANFHSLFPNVFHIKKIKDSEQNLLFHLESTSTDAICPYCGTASNTIHGKRYRKNISDLPFLDKPVILNITLNEYTCPKCSKNYVENPDSFLLERKSISARCEKYLSELKYSLNGSICDTLKFANYAHIPLNRGVIRYIPIKDIDIIDSDKLWIQDFVRNKYPDAQTAPKGKIPSPLAEKIVREIHLNCEKSLHPNLVTLSVYELNCVISQDK